MWVRVRVRVCVRLRLRVRVLERSQVKLCATACYAGGDGPGSSSGRELPVCAGQPCPTPIPPTPIAPIPP